MSRVKHTVREVILVEGKYDKNTLSQIVDATIFTTEGFGIFRDRKRLSLLRRMAEQRGLILFTDSDGAGLVIRNFLKSAIAPQYLKQAYIPDIPGKERRKHRAGKEGKLGVEGMTPDILLTALRRAGATFDDSPGGHDTRRGVTKQDLFDLGLSGTPDSAAHRRTLLRHLNLPENLSANALCDVLDALFDRDRLQAECDALFPEK